MMMMMMMEAPTAQSIQIDLSGQGLEKCNFVSRGQQAPPNKVDGKQRSLSRHWIFWQIQNILLKRMKTRIWWGRAAKYVGSGWDLFILLSHLFIVFIIFSLMFLILFSHLFIHSPLSSFYSSSSRRASAQAVTSKWQLRTTSPMNTNSSAGENGFSAKNGS